MPESGWRVTTSEQNGFAIMNFKYCLCVFLSDLPECLLSARAEASITVGSLFYGGSFSGGGRFYVDNNLVRELVEDRGVAAKVLEVGVYWIPRTLVSSK